MGGVQKIPGEINDLIDGNVEGSLAPLFEEILEVPNSRVEEGDGFRLLVSNIVYDNFVGSMALGKIRRGTIKKRRHFIP